MNLNWELETLQRADLIRMPADRSVLETPRAALQPILHQVGPDKLDHPRVVVTIGEVVI